MPVAIPKRDRHIISPWVASKAFLINGGTSGVVLGSLTSSIPKNTTAQHRRRKRLPKMARTAATVTAAERFRESSIEYLYITSSHGLEDSGESNAKKKRSLTFAFLSPKVPVENNCKGRRAHGSDQ